MNGRVGMASYPEPGVKKSNSEKEFRVDRVLSK